MQNKLDASIEYAHSYTGSQVGDSQILSAEIFRMNAEQFRRQGKSFSSVVLVDDINGLISENRNIVAGDLKKTLGEIDRLVFESELLSACKVLMRSLEKKDLSYVPFNKASKKVLFLKSDDSNIAIAEFKDKKFKPTCAFFVAAWHLIRLGAIDSLDFVPAEYSISILEEKFREVELKAKSIIRSSKYAEFSDRILHQFYQT